MTRVRPARRRERRDRQRSRPRRRDDGARRQRAGRPACCCATTSGPGSRRRSSSRASTSPATTDFRDVFAELLDRHMGLSNLGSIFPNFSRRPGELPGALRIAARRSGRGARRAATLAERGVAVVPDFLPRERVRATRAPRLRAWRAAARCVRRRSDAAPARTRRPEIRGDLVRWIDPAAPTRGEAARAGAHRATAPSR